MQKKQPITLWQARKMWSDEAIKMILSHVFDVRVTI